MKSIIAIIFCAMAFQAQAKDLTKDEKNDFVTFYREWAALEKEFPEDQEVKVMFVDLDQDGITEALATSRGSQYEDGSAWTAFRMADDSWSQISGFDPTKEKPKKTATLFARAGEFFRVNNGATVEFCTLSENYDKLAKGGKGPLNKTRFYLDDKGILHQIPIPDIERYLAYRASGAEWPNNTTIKSLERLPVEVFPTPKVDNK